MPSDPDAITTFRQLSEKVSRHGMPTDEKRTFWHMAIDCGVSRPSFYNGVRGTRKLSPETVAKIVAGYQKMAPWVTYEMVKAALMKSHSLFLRKQAKKQKASAEGFLP